MADPLRQLQQLAENSHASALLNQAARADKRLRQSLTSWLQGTPSAPRTDNAPPAGQAWQQWLNARNRAVKEAVARDNPDTQLIRGLFSPERDTGEHNPLTELLPTLATLQERLSSENNDPGIAAVWLLYQDDARRLLGNAMAQSACWLNNQWKYTVIWPLNRDSEEHNHEEQQRLSQ